MRSSRRQNLTYHWPSRGTISAPYFDGTFCIDGAWEADLNMKQLIRRLPPVKPGVFPEFEDIEQRLAYYVWWSHRPKCADCGRVTNRWAYQLTDMTAYECYECCRFRVHCGSSGVQREDDFQEVDGDHSDGDALSNSDSEGEKDHHGGKSAGAWEAHRMSITKLLEMIGQDLSTDLHSDVWRTTIRIAGALGLHTREILKQASVQVGDKKLKINCELVHCFYIATRAFDRNFMCWQHWNHQTGLNSSIPSWHRTQEISLALLELEIVPPLWVDVLPYLWQDIGWGDILCLKARVKEEPEEMFAILDGLHKQMPPDLIAAAYGLHLMMAIEDFSARDIARMDRWFLNNNCSGWREAVQRYVDEYGALFQPAYNILLCTGEPLPLGKIPKPYRVKGLRIPYELMRIECERIVRYICQKYGIPLVGRHSGFDVLSRKKVLTGARQLIGDYESCRTMRRAPISSWVAQIVWEMLQSQQLCSIIRRVSSSNKNVYGAVFSDHSLMHTALSYRHSRYNESFLHNWNLFIWNVRRPLIYIASQFHKSEQDQQWRLLHGLSVEMCQANPFGISGHCVLQGLTRNHYSHSDIMRTPMSRLQLQLLDFNEAVVDTLTTHELAHQVVLQNQYFVMSGSEDVWDEVLSNPKFGFETAGYRNIGPLPYEDWISLFADPMRAKIAVKFNVKRAIRDLNSPLLSSFDMARNSVKIKRTLLQTQLYLRALQYWRELLHINAQVLEFIPEGLDWPNVECPLQYCARLAWRASHLLMLSPLRQVYKAVYDALLDESDLDGGISWEDLAAQSSQVAAIFTARVVVAVQRMLDMRRGEEDEQPQSMLSLPQPQAISPQSAAAAASAAAGAAPTRPTEAPYVPAIHSAFPVGATQQAQFPPLPQPQSKSAGNTQARPSDGSAGVFKRAFNADEEPEARTLSSKPKPLPKREEDTKKVRFNDSHQSRYFSSCSPPTNFRDSSQTEATELTLSQSMGSPRGDAQPSVENPPQKSAPKEPRTKKRKFTQEETSSKSRQRNVESSRQSSARPNKDGYPEFMAFVEGHTPVEGVASRKEAVARLLLDAEADGVEPLPSLNNSLKHLLNGRELYTS